jgi:NitT/TauT family transport system permease protein
MLLRIIAIRAGVLGFIFGIWYFASTLGWVDARLLPPPTTVVTTLFGLFGDQTFLTHAAATFSRVLTVFAIGVPLAVVSGFMIAERKSTRERLSPVIYFLMGAPKSIFLPVFIQLFGVGTLQKVVFGVSYMYFALAAVTIAGVRSVSPQLVLAARSFGASRTGVYRTVYLRAILPTLVNGMRMALIFSIMGVLAAEMFASRSGLGQLIMVWGEEYRSAQMLAVVLLISAVTIVLNEAIALVERGLSPSREISAIQGANA